MSEGGNDWDSVIDYGTEALTLTVIPEPGTLALLGLAALGLTLRRRMAG